MIRVACLSGILPGARLRFKTLFARGAGLRRFLRWTHEVHKVTSREERGPRGIARSPPSRQDCAGLLSLSTIHNGTYNERVCRRPAAYALRGALLISATSPNRFLGGSALLIRATGANRFPRDRAKVQTQPPLCRGGFLTWSQNLDGPTGGLSGLSSFRHCVVPQCGRGAGLFPSLRKRNISCYIRNHNRTDRRFPLNSR